MITFSRLGQHGRLGNQMFQYAMLKGVQAASGLQAKVPPRHSPGFRLFDLFQIDCAPLDGPDRILREWSETTFAFQPEVFDVEDGTDFFGYFQTERYFIHATDQIRREFTFLAPVAAEADRVIAWLRDKGTSLVSLHVRRGDYLSKRDCHHVSEMGYYERARSLLPSDSLFVVCSDDLDWCRRAFRDWNTWFCDCDDATTLAIMGRCDHNIIAASSFSWWGAWLNRSARKRVIAPATWFGPAMQDLDTRDLLPASWLTIG